MFRDTRLGVGLGEFVNDPDEWHTVVSGVLLVLIILLVTDLGLITKVLFGLGFVYLDLKYPEETHYTLLGVLIGLCLYSLMSLFLLLVISFV